MKIIEKKSTPLKGIYLDIYKTEDFVFLTEKVNVASNGVVFDFKENFYDISMYESVWWTDGFISRFAKDKELFKNAVTSREQNIKNKTKQFKKIKEPFTSNINTVYINLLHCFQKYAFGHILDTLEKVLYIEKILTTISYQQICILIGNTSGLTGDKETFEHFVKALLPDKQIIFKQLENNTILECENLLTVKPLSHPACISSKEILLEINKRFVSYFKRVSIYANNFSKKIFLTRIPPLQRHIVNHNELHKVLKENNISIIFGKENIVDIFWAFCNAETIVGYHGAMFMYQMFCEKDPLVVEYNSAKRLHLSLSEKFFNINTTYQYFVEADEKHNAVLDINEVVNLY